jgi:hypothetical protein
MSIRLSAGPPLGQGPGLESSPGRRRRRWLALALALLTAVAVFLWLRPGSPPAPPSSLGGYRLAGPRGPSCLRLIIGMDVSGSMRDFTTPRDDALDQLAKWAGQPGTLRAGDELAIVDFAADAAVRSAPRPANQPPDLAQSSATDGTYTLLMPLLDQIALFPRTSCDSALVLLSDAQLNDLPGSAAEGNALLNRYGLHDMRLLVPSAEIQVPPQWTQAFPIAAPVVFDGTNSNETAIAFGRTIAGLAGQQLVARG